MLSFVNHCKSDITFPNGYWIESPCWLVHFDTYWTSKQKNHLSVFPKASDTSFHRLATLFSASDRWFHPISYVWGKKEKKRMQETREMERERERESWMWTEPSRGGGKLLETALKMLCFQTHLLHCHSAGDLCTSWIIIIC